MYGRRYSLRSLLIASVMVVNIDNEESKCEKKKFTVNREEEKKVKKAS